MAALVGRVSTMVVRLAAEAAAVEAAVLHLSYAVHPRSPVAPLPMVV
jgi:hypothetical protein